MFLSRSNCSVIRVCPSALVEVSPRQEGMTMVQVLSLRKDLTPTKSGSEKREGAKAHATRE